MELRIVHPGRRHCTTYRASNAIR